MAHVMTSTLFRINPEGVCSPFDVLRYLYDLHEVFPNLAVAFVHSSCVCSVASAEC